MAEISEVTLPYPKADAKNLVVRDEKKLNYYLITVKGDKRVELKELRKANSTRPLTFTSQDDLFSILSLIAGSVTPLGILNDEEKTVKVYLDKDFLDSPGLIGVHPNENTATVWLKTKDLIPIIKEHGSEIFTVAI